MQHQNAYIKTYSPQQVRAVVDEAQRLGYTVQCKPNYKYVEAVVFHSDGLLTLKLLDVFDEGFLEQQGYRKIKQTRHIRRDLCGSTYSQDGQAVLDVVEKSYLPNTVDVEPYKWIKPTAYNPIVQWFADKAFKVFNAVRNVAVAFIKHIK